MSLADNCIRTAGHAAGLDEPRRRASPPPPRASRSPPPAPAPRSPRSRTRPPAGRRAVPPRGDAHPARPAGAQPVPARLRRDRLRHGRRPTSPTRWSSRCARRSATGRAICGLSGGVDSAVAAALVQRAIGDRLTCVFVDHGLLRAGEREQVQRDFVAATGANLVTVDAADRFLEALAGVTDPEGKRKIIGREFIRAFEGAVRDIVARTRDLTSSSWCRARCTPTSWSPAAARAPPTSRATTTSAACPTT